MEEKHWWDGWQGLVSDTLGTFGEWFDYKSQVAASEAGASVAASTASAEAYKAKIASEERIGKTGTALIVGGSVLAVGLIITLVLIFRKK